MKSSPYRHTPWRAGPMPAVRYIRSPACDQSRRFQRIIEEYRDGRWRREATRQVETALEAERFIEQVGFAACLTDSTRPGPSLYVAVCGRRDAVMPRKVQKDPEASLTWVLAELAPAFERILFDRWVAGALYIYMYMTK